ncbi:MAG: DNA repair protein [Rhodocyclaceae bacterium]|jgi:DNA repair protein RadC|nr:DNA repair protein [Rhodocyclaceae bacterium]MBK6552921.1 DNA repair protein [Rhodocyclaceae bacterium]MBK6676404.1 DNA repair protein [Rhodocyclaceae bacterium]MBK9312456.1 DNA repair protein [Rhodocyclaceae bacterium]MBK9955866.1 DNA repair protein [Rhodocyclaceae bacterium]
MAAATISRRQQAGIRRPRPGDATILRAMAILERRLREPGELLASPGQVRAFLMLHLAELEHEAFVAIFVDAQNRLIEYRELFKGTLTQTSVYSREVVRAALAANAAAVIFAHNHPSGCAEPSHADEMLTQGLRQALALVDVRVNDHFIVAGNACPLSFAERGLL